MNIDNDNRAQLQNNFSAVDSAFDSSVHDDALSLDAALYAGFGGDDQGGAVQVPSICPLTSTKPSAVTPVVVSEDVIPESDWVPSPLNLTTNRSLPGLAPTLEILPPSS